MQVEVGAGWWFFRANPQVYARLWNLHFNSIVVSSLAGASSLSICWQYVHKYLHSGRVSFRCNSFGLKYNSRCDNQEWGWLGRLRGPVHIIKRMGKWNIQVIGKRRVSCLVCEAERVSFFCCLLFQEYEFFVKVRKINNQDMWIRGIKERKSL